MVSGAAGYFLLIEFKVKKHKSGFKWLAVFEFEKLAFFFFRFIQGFKTVFLIEVYSLRIVVSVYNDKAASCLVIHGTKPIFYEIKYLAPNIHSISLKFRRYSQPANQDSWEIYTTFCIRYTALNTIFGGLGNMLGLDTIIGNRY